MADFLLSVLFLNGKMKSTLYGENTSVQAHVEKPAMYMIVRCSSSDADQLCYSQERRNCLYKMDKPTAWWSLPVPTEEEREGRRSTIERGAKGKAKGRVKRNPLFRKFLEEDLKWNSFINTAGGKWGNMPLDLRLEQNTLLKAFLKPLDTNLNETNAAELQIVLSVSSIMASGTTTTIPELKKTRPMSVERRNFCRELRSALKKHNVESSADRGFRRATDDYYLNVPRGAVEGELRRTLRTQRYEQKRNRPRRVDSSQKVCLKRQRGELLASATLIRRQDLKVTVRLTSITEAGRRHPAIGDLQAFISQTTPPLDRTKEQAKHGTSAPLSAPGVLQSAQKRNEDHMKRLEQIKTKTAKDRRIALKVARAHEQEERKAWNKRRPVRHTYGEEDGGVEDSDSDDSEHVSSGDEDAKAAASKAPLHGQRRSHQTAPTTTRILLDPPAQNSTPRRPEPRIPRNHQGMKSTKNFVVTGTPKNIYYLIKLDRKMGRGDKIKPISGLARHHTQALGSLFNYQEKHMHRKPAATQQVADIALLMKVVMLPVSHQRRELPGDITDWPHEYVRFYPVVSPVQSIKKEPNTQRYQRLVGSIYGYFANSTSRQARLKEMTDIQETDCQAQIYPCALPAVKEVLKTDGEELHDAIRHSKSVIRAIYLKTTLDQLVVLPRLQMDTALYNNLFKEVSDREEVSSMDYSEAFLLSQRSLWSRHNRCRPTIPPTVYGNKLCQAPSRRK
ncbi:hypothetical protein Bbelb_283640 [Branchiostoma belcheri]|nr:hypothetical protein Bbelb_283640 [Branchiostoma belcheri]